MRRRRRKRTRGRLHVCQNRSCIDSSKSRSRRSSRKRRRGRMVKKRRRRRRRRMVIVSALHELVLLHVCHPLHELVPRYFWFPATLPPIHFHHVWLPARVSYMCIWLNAPSACQLGARLRHLATPIAASLLAAPITASLLATPIAASLTPLVCSHSFFISFPFLICPATAPEPHGCDDPAHSPRRGRSRLRL